MRDLERNKAGYNQVVGKNEFGARWIKKGKYYNGQGEELNMKSGEVVGVVPTEDYHLFGIVGEESKVSPTESSNAPAVPSNKTVIGKVDPPDEEAFISTNADQAEKEDELFKLKAKVSFEKSKVEELEGEEKPDKKELMKARARLTKAKNALERAEQE